MKCEDYGSPAFASHRNVRCSSSIPSSASTTSAWSSASSQNSDDTSVTAPTSSSDFYESSYCGSKINNLWGWQSRSSAPEVPPESRTNPRRTTHSSTTRTGRYPSLPHQAERKGNFVDSLVDSSTHIVEAIWPTSSAICRNDPDGAGVLPLRTFIKETLRRSRTSYSTLQVALYYLLLIKPHVPARDFTMEQLDDCHATRAILCGRRMFLAALILASKYLQDRNYSARAWSKISGLHMLEINQNEMAFLLAVKWKLHVTEAVYNRWIECVNKFTPPPTPPSPGGPTAQTIEFRSLILNLRPDLDNLDELTLASWSPIRAHLSPPRSLYTPSIERVCAFGQDVDLTPLARPFGTPTFLEPNPVSVHTPGRLAPAMGLLPTPRMTPHGSGYSTPAVSATSHLLGRTSMGFAMTQACSVGSAQPMDRWPSSLTSSPQSYVIRRSSLANSMSTASSPESMVSDTSRSSRSSSISSSSSLATAPSSRLDVQARCRFAKSSGERINLMPTIVSEEYEENFITSSPEIFTSTVTKDSGGLRMETALARREREVREAACTLQDLRNHGRLLATHAPVPRVGLKRSRTTSMDNPLQDNVRQLLAGHSNFGQGAWSDNLLQPRTNYAERAQQIAISSCIEGARKRVCYSGEVAEPQTISSRHPVMGGAEGPGMWEGTLN